MSQQPSSDDKPVISIEDDSQTPPVNASTDTKDGGGWRGLIVTVVVALGIAIFLQAFVAKPFKIPSASMVPTLKEGDRILVDRVTPRFTDWNVGDIVVFRPPVSVLGLGDECAVKHSAEQACPKAVSKRANTYYVKRIVALAGDRVFIKDGEIYRNGKPVRIKNARLDKTCELCQMPTPITIPKGTVMMMGDNRGNSEDSRAWGPAPTKWITGKVRVTYWPLNRLDTF